jgi:hypothetical protein
MNPPRHIPTPGMATLPPVESPATLRLSHNRERLAAWLAADRAKRSRPSLMGWAAGAAWPLIQGLRGYPSVSLAAGALVQRLLRPAPATLVVPAPPVASPPVLHLGLALVRRHPGATVAVVAAAAGAVWLLSRSPAPRTSPPLK